MKFFFAENCDWIDPQYDFLRDIGNADRVPHSDDLYAHEYFEKPPYDGLLISRNIVGGGCFKGKYTQTQRHRLMREGIRSFLRYPGNSFNGPSEDYPIMGDCGSYSFINSETPPISNEEMVEYYDQCGFTHGVSVDHIVKEKQTLWDDRRRLPAHIESRVEFTHRSAVDFLHLTQKKHACFTPIGVVQSWSPKSAGQYARQLVDAGYDYIGLGGLVGHTWDVIYNTVSEVRSQVNSDTRIHVFGFTFIKKIDRFVGLDITSFDSTAPILKAFKDDQENYFADEDPHYLAIRVPPWNEKSIKRRVQSGELNQTHTARLEKDAMDALRAYDQQKVKIEEALDAVTSYEQYLYPSKRLRERYKRTLEDRPWKKCPCRICKEIGIEALIYRGLNRNKRRGFHNLWYVQQRLEKVKRSVDKLSVPCIKTQQNPDRHLYSFVVDGKRIAQFATVSRVGRDEGGQLAGYQRPEVQDHISDIRSYIEQPNAILPNSIVIAFQGLLDFEEIKRVDSESSVGTLHIPISEKDKLGWIVDGQQRAAALRTAKKEKMPVSVVAFESKNVTEEREQFVLVNTTKPLPRSLVYELLPNIDGHIPPKMKKRKAAYILLEELNLVEDSPFYLRIQTTTARHIESANIKDMSVLKMLENSMRDGILYRFQKNQIKMIALLHNFWLAVRSFYPEAWGVGPRKSRLTHGVGIVSMGYLMDTVAYRLIRDETVPTVEEFKREIKILGRSLPWMDGVWHFSDNLILPWNELQNTSRHIDILSNHLIRIYRKKNA